MERFINLCLFFLNMAYELTVGEKIFGREYNSHLEDLFFKSDATPAEAREVIAAIVHPEIRRVVESLESQMARGSNSVTYPLSRSEKLRQDMEYGMALINKVDVTDGAFLFSDFSIWNGLLNGFYNLLGRAFPNYEVLKEQPIGEVQMRKRERLN